MIFDPRTIENPDEVSQLVMPRKGPGYREELRAAVQEKVDAAKAANGETTSDELPLNGNSEQSLSPEEQTYKKRYGDLRRHNEQQRQSLQKQVDELRRQLEATTQKTMVLPKSREDVQAWMNAYPDVAAIVETIAGLKANEASTQVIERMKQLEDEANEAKRTRAEIEIRQLHPDFDEVISTQEFHDWATLQDTDVQSWLFDNPDNPKLCSRAINLYKLEKGKLNSKPQVSKAEYEREASRMVKPTTSQAEPNAGPKGPVFKESEVAKMSPKKFDELEPQIMKAIAEGRFVYDMSAKN